MEEEELHKILEAMLIEDRYLEDVTTAFTPNMKVKAKIVAREGGVVAGTNEIKTLFKMSNTDVDIIKNDGETFDSGETIILLRGKSHDILPLERTALNLIGRMSGVATFTKKFVDAVKETNPNVSIACTRKTTPILRYFEKKAVECGGGMRHRNDLSEAVLIKDNHLTLFSDVSEAIQAAKKMHGDKLKIEIEVEDQHSAILAAEESPDIIMLDNFSPEDAASTIKLIKERSPKKNIKIEVSGGITLKNVKEYAATGADIISTGAITSSVRSIDFSMEAKL